MSSSDSEDASSLLEVFELLSVLVLLSELERLGYRLVTLRSSVDSSEHSKCSNSKSERTICIFCKVSMVSEEYQFQADLIVIYLIDTDIS